MDKIEQLISLTLKSCESCVKVDHDGELKFIDPIDKQEISAHYGATHAACAFIVLGDSREDKRLIEKGKNLLISVLKRWDYSKEIYGFHNDFNSFALCVAYDALKDQDAKLCEEIKAKVCATKDSNHDTINWLPMRWYVNLKRYQWTSDVKYQKNYQECKIKISKATNNDGGIEDVLPKGTSFNLQYDIATVAALQFLNCRGLNIDLSKELSFLIQNIAPDGDVNYQGRGTNQVFAWGMWVYLLSSSNNEAELSKALSFLEKKVPIMLENNNLFLNDVNGEDKYLWWDYHYSSVYTAHFLFWLVLSLKDSKEKPIKLKNSLLKDSGLFISKSSNHFVATFNGRKKYVSETGPIISAIWLKDYGTIFKGTLGPWQGSFGNKYTYGDIVLRNYVGLLKVERNKNWTKNRIIHKLWPNIKVNNYIKMSPIMVPFTINDLGNALVIKFDNTKNENLILNLPILDTITKKPKISLLINDEKVMLQNNTKIKTQYGWCSIFQSRTFNAKEWVLMIE